MINDNMNQNQNSTIRRHQTKTKTKDHVLDIEHQHQVHRSGIIDCPEVTSITRKTINNSNSIESVVASIEH